MTLCLDMYVVYYDPRDYPGSYVVRKWRVDGADPTPKPDADVTTVCNSLAEARSHIPVGLANIGRQPNDDRTIREVWV